MFKIYLPLIVICWMTSYGISQEVTIVLTSTVYDRDLTEAETKEAQERLDKARKSEEASSFSLESYRILDARAERLNRRSTTVVLEVGKSVRYSDDAHDMLQAAHIKVLKLDENDCQVNVDWAVGMVRAKSTDCHAIYGMRTVKLNQLEVIGGGKDEVIVKGKKQTNYLVKTILIVPGKQHPLAATQDVAEFVNAESIRRLQRKLPRPGNLTSRE